MADEDRDDQVNDDPGDALPLQPLTGVRRSRPKALWAVLAAVAVAAGALVVTNVGDSSDTAQGAPIPISLLNGGGRSEAAAADSSLAWIRYEAGPDLPTLGGTAPVYRLGSVTEAQVRDLAAVLGVEGDPRQESGQWTVQDGDHLLNVSEAGGAWWFNAAAVAVSDGGSGSSGSAGSATAPACLPDTECQAIPTTTYVECSGRTDDCVIPPYDPCASDPVAANIDCAGVPDASVPPDSVPGAVGPPESMPPETMPPDEAPCAKVISVECGTAPDPDLPSEDEARDVALELLRQTGTDVDGAAITVDGGVGIWVVSVEPALDGRPSGLVAQALVGPDSVIQGANGFLAEPTQVGTYPVLTTSEAIDRANATMDGSGVAGGPTPAIGTTDVAGDIADDVAARDDAVATGGSVVDAATTTVTGCKPQPTGIEICEPIGTVAPDPALVDPVPTVTAEPGATTCESTDISEVCQGGGSSTPGDPGTGIVPPPTVPDTTIPEPAAVVLVDATPTFMLMGANDGTGDGYLVPAYRFTPEGGGQVDLIALSDEAIAGPPSTATTVPATDVPLPDPGGVDGGEVPPSKCDVLIQGDDTGTTMTVQPCAGQDPTDPADPVALPAGQEPALGVGYFVDVDLECGPGMFDFAGRIWVAEDDTLVGSTARGEGFEGGTFTLDSLEHGTFVGDAAGTKLTTFHPLGPAEDIFCQPEHRG